MIDAVNGVLSWSDVTHWTGDIPAHGTVVVTTVFTALAAIDSTVNRAEVGSASDWYGNDLGGGGDDVPITIIEGPTPTSAPAPTATPLPAPTATRAQPAPTAVPITVVPAATTTPAPAMPTPFFLPESGQAKERWSSGLLMMAVVVGAGMFVLVHRKQSS